jgi:hypothetical protein
VDQEVGEEEGIGAEGEIDPEDGAQVWRERLAAVGWGYDEDEEGEDDVEEEGAEEAEDEDAEIDALLSEMLQEVTPFGTWFAGVLHAGCVAHFSTFRV